MGLAQTRPTITDVHLVERKKSKEKNWDPAGKQTWDPESRGAEASLLIQAARLNSKFQLFFYFSQLVSLPIVNGDLLWRGLWAWDGLAVQAHGLSDLLSPSVIQPLV